MMIQKLYPFWHPKFGQKLLMLFETCWLYQKNDQSNKKFAEHHNYYSILFLNFNLL